MPKIDITRPELIWPGKYDEHGNRVENRGTALPFQVDRDDQGRAGHPCPGAHWRSLRVFNLSGREQLAQ